MTNFMCTALFRQRTQEQNETGHVFIRSDMATSPIDPCIWALKCELAATANVNNI